MQAHKRLAPAVAGFAGLLGYGVMRGTLGQRLLIGKEPKIFGSVLFWRHKLERVEANKPDCCDCHHK